MTDDISIRSDWQKPADYLYCLDLDRMGLAWEFLRRNPAYRAVVRAAAGFSNGAVVDLSASASRGAAPWGLCFPRR